MSDEEIIHRIPLFQLVKDEELLTNLNQRLNDLLVQNILGEEISSLFTIPELEIIGASEVFNRNDDEFAIKYPRIEDKKITNLTIETLRIYCEENKIDTPENINKIKIGRFNNGSLVVTSPLINIIEYTDDENKCILSNGKWYMYNRDYLTYLNDSVKEIMAIYKSQYDFNDNIHNQFIEEKYKLEKNENKYDGKTEYEIKKDLKKKYYAERCFNLLRESEGTFNNYDRVGTTAGFEIMDLYEIANATMFAVKMGKASSDLCYAVDQSLVSLKKYKHGEIHNMPNIENVGLWFILERAKHLHTDEQYKVDLSSLDMLMLKNRIDQWKKGVRLSGFKPIIYINYRS